VGFEPTALTCNSKDLQQSIDSNRENQAKNPAESAPTDLDLAKMVKAWPDLPEAVRAGIRAMVQAAGKGKSDA